MESAVHRFVRILRLSGVRVSVAEGLDAMAATALPGVLDDRDTVRAALRSALVKDRRDLAVFDRVFDAFFALRPALPVPPDHGHEHDDLADTGQVERFTLSDEVGQTPQQGHSHGKPADIRDYFRPQDLATRYNLHQEAAKIDLSAATSEVVLSADAGATPADAARVQVSVRRLHNAGVPGQLSSGPAVHLDADLSVAEEMVLLGWLADTDLLDDLLDVAAGDRDDPRVAAAMQAWRHALGPLLQGLPERLKRHLQDLLAASGIDVEGRSFEASAAELLDERDRAEIEQSLRRVLRSLRGAPRARRRVARRGSVDGPRTMRSSMRFDAVPFQAVTVAKVEDRPRLVVLADASLSVRGTARFTLQLVHTLQSVAASVRSFVFVDRTAEVTEVFADHQLAEALSLVMAGPEGGGPLDVDADSDYGAAFADFMTEYGSALTRRTTLVVLGDGRGNGHEPRFGLFEEMARRCRATIWLTPEPRSSWLLGRCDLPGYAEFCDDVHVVRGPKSLDGFATTMLGVGR